MKTKMKASAPVRLILALVLLSGLVHPLTVGAEPAAGTVEGVIELGGQPVAGARVVLACSARSDYEESTTSDASGSFSFTGVPLGAFSIQVFDSDDLLVAEGTGTLTEDGETVTVELAAP